MNICLNCSNVTTNPRFCSRSCAAVFNNKATGSRNPRNRPKPRTCCCGTVYFWSTSNRSLFCPSCAQKRREKFLPEYLKQLTLADYHQLPSIVGKHPSWRNAHIRSLNRSWNSDLAASSCVACGYTKHVELAHIRPITSFPESATLGEVNSRKNIVPLCRNCHWEFDHGLLLLPTHI